MKKILALITTFLLTASPTFAMTTPVMISGGGGNFPSTGSVSYIAFMGAGTSGAGYGFNTFEPLSDTVVSTPGTITNLQAKFPQAVTGAQTYTVTLVKNGSATALTCQITSAGLSCSDASHSVTIAAGDTLAMSVTPSGSPTAQTSGPYISVQFDGTASGVSFIQAGTNSESNSAVNYFAIGMYSIAGTPESSFQIAAPTAGTFSNLYTVGGIPGAGKSYAVTLRKNGADTTLVATASGAGSGSANDTTHTVSVAAGDLIDFSGTPTGTPAGGVAYASMTFTPTIPGESIVVGGTTNVFASGTFYLNFNGGYGVGTESVTQNIAPLAFTVKNLYANVSAAPGVATSRAYTGRLNGSNQTLTCTISNTNTACTPDTTHNFTVAAGDLLGWSSVPTGSPGFALHYVSAVVYIAPPAAPTVNSVFSNFGQLFLNGLFNLY